MHTTPNIALYQVWVEYPDGTVEVPEYLQQPDSLDDLAGSAIDSMGDDAWLRIFKFNPSEGTSSEITYDWLIDRAEEQFRSGDEMYPPYPAATDIFREVFNGESAAAFNGGNSVVDGRGYRVAAE